MPMIPIDTISGKQLLNARNSKSPAVVVDSLTIRIPPAARGEREHKVQLDDQERPTACSCTCEHGLRGEPCWAMARALAVLQVLGSNRIYVSRGVTAAWLALAAAASAVEHTASACVSEGGDMDLLWGEQPQAGLLYNVSR